MKSVFCTFLLLMISLSTNANYRMTDNADFKMECDTGKVGPVTITYSSNKQRTLETAELNVDGEVFNPNMTKTFFSHAVSPYKNTITGHFQYMYHGNLQFQSHDGSVFTRVKFHLNQNLSKDRTASSIYTARNEMKMNVSLSLRQNKEWITFKGLCSLSYSKL